MSMRCNDIASTSFRRHVPTRFLINQCQIITFLIVKSDNIENSRVELKGMPVPSNQITVTFLLFYPSTWYICDFFLFHIEIEGKWGQRVCWPPSQIIGGPGPPGPPLPTPIGWGGGWKGEEDGGGWRGRLQYSREDRGGGGCCNTPCHLDNFGRIFLIDGSQGNFVEKYTYL